MVILYYRITVVIKMTFSEQIRQEVQSYHGMKSAPEVGRMYGMHRNTVLRIWKEIDEPWRVMDKASAADNRILRAVYTHIHPSLSTDQDRELYEAILKVMT